MPRHHMINNEKVPFTIEEEAARDADEAAWVAGASDRAFTELREKRNRLLKDTDWWASNDLSMTQAQKDYRQALRDLPANTPDPVSPTWPVAPV